MCTDSTQYAPHALIVLVCFREGNANDASKPGLPFPSDRTAFFADAAWRSPQKQVTCFEFYETFAPYSCWWCFTLWRKTSLSYFSVGDETTNSPFVPAFIRVAHVSLPLGRKERTGPFFSDGARLIARYDVSTARNDGGGGQIKVELYLIRVVRIHESGSSDFRQWFVSALFCNLQIRRDARKLFSR